MSMRAPLALAKPRTLCVPSDPHLKGLDRQVQVVLGAGWGGKVEDVIQLTCYVDVFGDIVEHKLEIGIPEMVLDIGHVACEQVVHDDDLIALFQGAIGQMRTQKACATCDENAFFPGSCHAQEFTVLDCNALTTPRPMEL